MPPTVVGISGTDFTLNGMPTYPGRTFEGCRIEGLLFNVRAVQATFDDANPDTRQHWVYPDTGRWDPARNVEEFCAALPSWRDHGVLAFTINVQGGGPRYTPEVYSRFDNSGFTQAGELKPAYADRIARVLARADQLGMVVIVGMFYVAHVRKLWDEAAVWRAARETMAFLEGRGRRNVLIEVANETELVYGRGGGYDIFRPERAHAMIEELRAAHPGFRYSTSQLGLNAETGAGLPPASLLRAADFVLIHGNGTRPAGLEAGIKAIRAMPEYQAHPKPIVVNEDSTAVGNLDAAWRNGASWGYYDQGFGSAYGGDLWVDFRARPRETDHASLSGFQTPPINWTINTDRKRAFFRRVAEVTGYPGSDE